MFKITEEPSFAKNALEAGVELNGSANASSAERANQLFDEQRQDIYRNTDQLFAKLMLFQWLAAILMAFIISPRTWTGQSSAIHIHVWAAIFLGGAISLFPIWMTRVWPGAAITRHIIAVAQMLMSALLISVTGGRIETHFHVFGSLVILSFYRDWRVLIPATIVVGLDHFLRGVYWPYSVYGVLGASPWRSIEHAAWVVFEDIFLVISCFRSIREMRSIANRTAALEASEQSFRQIFEEGPIGIAIVDLDQRFINVNTSVSQMIGYSGEELVGKNTLELTYPEDIEKDQEIAKALFAGANRCSFEKRYVRKNGELLWVNLTASIMRDKDGKPHHYVTMLKDVTEARRAEDALHESKRELEVAVQANQLIMDNSLDVICTVDEEGRFLTVNAASEHLWGYTPAELIGRKYIDFVHPDDRARTTQTEANLKIEGKVTDFVNRYIRKDGALVDVLWSATWSESAKTFFGVAHDVTERAKMEKALQEAKDEADRANHAKSDFLSRMSHELRTPLNAILGFGQLLERQNPTDIQRTRLSHIISAGRHLLDLINEILDIARIEAGRLQLSLEPVQVSEALNEAVDLVRPLAAERNVQIQITGSVNSDPSILADRQRLKQVLLNLLANAVKYNRAAGRVFVALEEQPGRRLRILISDEGPGIPASKRSRLFSPFDRLGAENCEMQGTGLGLALSKRLTEAMGGAIGESAPASGASFWIEFPLVANLVGTLGKISRGIPATSLIDLGDKIKTLLYIEDNLSNLTLIEHLLEGHSPIKLISAMQGVLGLELAVRHQPDLILLDVHLPDITGTEVLARLRTEPRTRDIPVVVLSADATKGQVDRLMAVGANDYLTKPLDMDRFLKVVDEHCRKASLVGCNGKNGV
jgi:PAS domain S-box-containing protein